ncbi:D-aminoacyl-tRNA deacylase [Desulfonatronovibrio hydrogenovorans]|uniref:D-aminoacyl-tRNA deacylase n=1 Tax=Desulfonatronovibrio hydrogenovorans TaxID=53245 RepID=UPI00307E07F0
MQRVKWARVKVDSLVAGEIENGLMVLIGFSARDTDLPGQRPWKTIIAKLPRLRVFSDDLGNLNLSLKDVQGRILLIPQFTLYADCRKGRRPGFSGSAPYDVARDLFERFAADLAREGPGVALGVFGAEMEVELNNFGPVTIMLDSDDFFC